MECMVTGSEWRTREVDMVKVENCLVTQSDKSQYLELIGENGYNSQNQPRMFEVETACRLSVIVCMPLRLKEPLYRQQLCVKCFVE